ncbi:hypothetical protein NA78x_004446 [Anatilimnocola sp. NA78]|uniref:hypothetical protein n=1 Tax=Anatilimnocola sp. NA78 TaxID=3415683 RepID=UPI003CE49FE9
MSIPHSLFDDDNLEHFVYFCDQIVQADSHIQLRLLPLLEQPFNFSVGPLEFYLWGLNGSAGRVRARLYEYYRDPKDNIRNRLDRLLSRRSISVDNVELGLAAPLVVTTASDAVRMIAVTVSIRVNYLSISCDPDFRADCASRSAFKRYTQLSPCSDYAVDDTQPDVSGLQFVADDVVPIVIRGKDAMLRFVKTMDGVLWEVVIYLFGDDTTILAGDLLHRRSRWQEVSELKVGLYPYVLYSQFGHVLAVRD